MLYFLTGTKYTGTCSMDGSTEARAAATAAGYTAVWFDETPAFHTRWVNTPAGEGGGEIVIELTLDEFKEVRGAELSHQAGQFDQYKCADMFVTSSLGYKINADIRSQTNMQGLIDMMSETDTATYKDYENQFHSVSRAELETMKSEALQNGANLYQQKFRQEAQLAACTSIAELAALKFEFVMLDFSA